MQAVSNLALIGRSYPQDAYVALQRAFEPARRAKKQTFKAQPLWRTPAEPVIVPSRLFH